MKNTLFDNFHIIYIITSLFLTVLILFLLNKFIKKREHKNIILIILGALTFFIHISELWVFFLSKKEAIVADNILFPIYFCNLSMILLLITSLIRNKQGKVFNLLAITTSYAAIFGSIISLFYPEFYTYETGFSYHIFKSFLSHSVMLLGALYLLTNDYFKIERKNAITFTKGLSIFLIDGIIVNLIFYIAKLDTPNSMYLLKPPIEGLWILNAYVIAILFILVIYLVGLSAEIIKQRTESEKIIKVV